EFAALGVPFERRGAMANEYLSIIRDYWTKDKISYSGSFTSFRDVTTGPRPARSPRPPIWVGGSSEGALRRAVRFGDGWHPTRVRIERLRNEDLPQLQAIATEEALAVPALCPRLKLRITNTALPDDNRLAGQGTLEQIRADLNILEDLGSQYVLFDTYDDDPNATRTPERDWAALSKLAQQVLDLTR